MPSPFNSCPLNLMTFIFLVPPMPSQTLCNFVFVAVESPLRDEVVLRAFSFPDFQNNGVLVMKAACSALFAQFLL